MEQWELPVGEASLEGKAIDVPRLPSSVPCCHMDNNSKR